MSDSGDSSEQSARRDPSNVPRPSGSLRSEKRAVRAELRAQRRAVAARRDREADDRALAGQVATLCDRMGIGAGATATLYEALPEEPPTAGMAEVLQERGVRVLVPLTLPDLDLDWADLADESRAPLGLDGIHGADLVLIPGLAVDASGTRLGQGGGCYDKALPRRAPGRRVIVILHPEEFTAALLPREDHDVLVDAVLTADGATQITARHRA